MEGKREEKIRKWELLVRERLDSGMSVTEFCEARGYTINMYYHWVNSIHKADPDFDTRGPAADPAPQTNTFVEIKKPDVPSPVQEKPQPSYGRPGRLPAAVIRADSLKIELFSNASAQFMGQLLEAVRHV